MISRRSGSKAGSKAGEAKAREVVVSVHPGSVAASAIMARKLDEVKEEYHRSERAHEQCRAETAKLRTVIRKMAEVLREAVEEDDDQEQ